MSNWLKVFPYSNGLSILPFIVSALVIVITATAMFHSAKAALAKNNYIVAFLQLTSPRQYQQEENPVFSPFIFYD